MESSLLSIGSFLLSLVTNIIVIRLATRSGRFIDTDKTDKPQRFHERATPRAGGIGVLAGLLPLAGLPMGWKLLLPSLLALFSGVFEDFHQSLSPKRRLFVQLAAALTAVFLTGTVVSYLGFGIHLPTWWALLFSAFAIVGVMNAVNIIDGFNGLAAGVSLLILISFALTAERLGLPEAGRTIGLIIGSLAGFLVLNFPRGKIFLGDGGAYLLGFLLAVIGIYLAGSQEKVSPWYILATLIYPVWEVIFSIFRKWYEGRSPLEPDPFHLHMLVYRHLTRSNPLTSVVLLSAYFPFLAAATLFSNNSRFNFLLVIFFILCYSLWYRSLRRGEARS